MASVLNALVILRILVNPVRVGAPLTRNVKKDLYVHQESVTVDIYMNEMRE